jgi:sugar lactone lactonase YvrE
MTVDAEGRIYASGRVGVQVISARGELLGVIPVPRSATSVAFSGPDKKRLYVIGVGALDSTGKEMPDEHAKTIFELPMLGQGFKGRAK